MPLIDHFRDPVRLTHDWGSFHSNWATRIADRLNRTWLPPEFVAQEYTYGRRQEIDVATYEQRPSPPSANGHAGSAVALWSPGVATATATMPLPANFEVRIYSLVGGRTLVAAVELVSPGNKNQPRTRRAFAAKCVSYLTRGVALSVIDIVTVRRHNLHDLTMDLLQCPPETRFAEPTPLYATAYRPVARGGGTHVDVWLEPLQLGGELPTMPLRLTGDLFVPVEYEMTYTEARESRRMA